MAQVNFHFTIYIEFIENYVVCLFKYLYYVVVWVLLYFLIYVYQFDSEIKFVIFFLVITLK